MVRAISARVGSVWRSPSWRSECRGQACLFSRAKQRLLVAYQDPFSPFPLTQPDFDVAVCLAERFDSHAGSLRHQTSKVRSSYFGVNLLKGLCKKG